MPAPDLPPCGTEPDTLARHGGNLPVARATFPHAPEPWLDLSTGINPHAYPIGALPDDAWHRLPDIADEAALTASARAAYDAPHAAAIVAAPGTQALIQLLPRVLPARRVAIWGFGYQEHPAVWRAAGAAVTVTDDLESLAEADVAIVVNPNNPDGRHADPGRLASLASRLAPRGGTLLVDEAFADTLPRVASLVPTLQPCGALVLRSFGKFFGLAGLRLGFAIGDVTPCDALRRELGPWAVSGPALAIGARALADRAWQTAMRERLAAEAERLDAVLARAGLAVVGGTSLFRLVRSPDAPAIFSRLGRAGILVRPFRHEPGWLRFGLPGSAASLSRLAQALTG